MKKFFKFMVTVLCLVLLAGTVGAAELTVKDIPGAYDDVYDTPGFEAATGPDTFPLTGKEIVIIKNTSGSDSLVTLVSVPDDLGRTNDLSDTVPAGEQVIVGPMQRKGWRSAAGNLEINYPDGTSGIEVAVVRLKPPF